MKKYTLITILLIFFIGQNLSAQLQANQTNMKLFDDYSPDKTGTVDVSDLLQTAVDYCIGNAKTLYISPGTYLVTKRIYAKVFIGLSCGTHNGTNMIAITGDAFNHPVIKLQDGAVGFQDTNIANALAVLHVQHDLGDSGESCVFWCQLKNLDFDLGNNPGAVAIRMAAAQDAQISNIKVYGQNFAAGFTGIPGRNSGTFNCEVTGGKYAFYINNSLGATIYGIRCINQSVAALSLAIWRGTAIVGLDISGCNGTGIISRNTTNSADARYYQGHLVLTDAKIELTNSSNYALDVADRALVMRNVYVKGTNNIVKSNSGNYIESITNWGRVKFFSVLPTNINSLASYNLINDVKNTNQMKDFETTSEAPTNFVTKHIPHKIYAFNSPGAVNVASYGAIPSASASVNYNAIQKAINENDIVYIPAGKYNLSATLNLKNNSVLLGDPGKQTQLTPTYTPSTYSWMIITPNIDGYAVVQDLAFNVPDKAFYGAIKWQTSNGFMLNVLNYLAASWSEKARQDYVFTGKAGGRFFGICEGTSLYNTVTTPSPDYHKLIIDGTSNPITFYGLNLERGGDTGGVPQNPFAIFTNSSNIRIFGSKTETDGMVYSLSGCNNISFNLIMSHAFINPLIDSKIMGISNATTNMEVNVIFCPYTASTVTMIDDETNDYVKRNEFIGTYRIGNFDPAVFDQTELTKLNDYTTEKYLVYPTVTKALLNINYSKNLKSIKLINLTGISIREWNNKNQIDISEFTKGVYFVQLTDYSGLIYIQKIIKQ